MTQPAMTDLPRICKRPLDAGAHTSGRAADEIDIAGCATIAYSSEDPAHPVEHLLDGHPVPRSHALDQRAPRHHPAYRRGIRPAAGGLAARL
jgi:hypothetical protein